MKQRSVTEWAAIAEIIGTITVVVSLLFVAYSINRNTAVLQATNENFIYQLQDDEFSDLSSNPNLASLLLKHHDSEDFTDRELAQYAAHVSRLLNRWELLFNRYRQGLISAEQWEGWNRYYATDFPNQFPKEWWPDWRYSYHSDFASHVDEVLSGH